jgi:hypothetical protein
LIANNNSWAVTIPSTIASGPYVLRHEIIALHGAENSDGAQNYPQCINIEVTGGGSDVPSGTLGEALYKETEPGILVNIYTTGLKYTIPGPALYTGGSGKSAKFTTVVAATTSAAVKVSSTAAAVVTSARASASAVPTTFATSVKSATSSFAAEPSAAAEDDTCDA